MEPDEDVTVVDPRLAAGRGEQFSAAFRRQLEEDALDEIDYRLPIGHRPENSVDVEEQATLDKAISEDNIGFKLLQKMGWKGKGLGRNEDGIVEPVRAGADPGVRLGVGKQEEDNFYTAADNITRKRLETEIQATEDEERRARREALAERDQRIKEDVSQIKRTFFCEVCSKQYNTAMELDTHLSSYDHHHKKRLVEMKAMTAERTRGSRLKKEERRMAKEMERLNDQLRRAQEAQQKLTGVPAPPPLPSEPAPPLPPPSEDPSPPPPSPPGPSTDPYAAYPPAHPSAHPPAHPHPGAYPSSLPSSVSHAHSSHQHHPAAPSYHAAASSYHAAASSYHSQPGAYGAAPPAAHPQQAGWGQQYPPGPAGPSAPHDPHTSWQQYPPHHQHQHQHTGWSAAGPPSSHQQAAAGWHAPASSTAAVHPPAVQHYNGGTVAPAAPAAAGPPAASQPTQPGPPAPAAAAAPAIGAQGMTIKLGGAAAGARPRTAGFGAAGAKRGAAGTLGSKAGKQVKMQPAAGIFGVDSDEEDS